MESHLALGCLVMLVVWFCGGPVFAGELTELRTDVCVVGGGSGGIGAAIGAALVVQHYLFAGIIMLFPHIINFLMYLYWRIQHKRHPDDEKWKIVKWGRVREDGTLEVPNRLTLKWVLPYYFRMTEQQATYAMYLLTTVFCVLALFVPG